MLSITLATIAAAKPKKKMRNSVLLFTLQAKVFGGREQTDIRKNRHMVCDTEFALH